MCSKPVWKMDDMKATLLYHAHVSGTSTKWVSTRPTAIRPRVRKSRYWGEMLPSPNHCCDVTKPPYLLSGELCTSPLHSNRLYVYTICCQRGGQCFSVLRTGHTDVVDDSSGRRYVTEQGHNVPLLRTRALDHLLHSIWTYSRDSLGFSVAPIPSAHVTKYRAVPLLLTRRFCIQTVL